MSMISSGPGEREGEGGTGTFFGSYGTGYGQFGTPMGNRASASGGLPLGTFMAPNVTNPNTSALLGGGLDNAFETAGLADVTGKLPAALLASQGTNWNDLLKHFLSPQGLMSLAGLAATVKGGGGAGGAFPLEDELRQAMQAQQRRVAYADPLYNATVNAAFAGLPTYARQGVSAPGTSRG